MSGLFPSAEFLGLITFAGSLIALLAKPVARPRPIAVRHDMDAPAGRPRRSMSRTEADFPSTGVC